MTQPAGPFPGNNKVVELPGCMNPVLAVLTFVPMIVIIMIALTFAVEKTPTVLIVLLTVVAGCCAMLSWSALQIMLGGTLTFEEDGITVGRLLSKERYSWSSIEACKVMPATGTLGDNALIEADDRAGVGLFLRGLDRTRDHDLDADVILCAGAKSHLQPLMHIASKVDAAIKRAQAPALRGPARAPQSGLRRPLRQRQPGKKRSVTAQSKVDPVAAFRNRQTSD